nr:PREDICTED: uncharacterized protein LOC107399200 [Tribolium castaneum]|eukprot:XP_015840445.1 PREDICTED: uncharacterized protein LOC107399200 [Tribolium castaneum]
MIKKRSKLISRNKAFQRKIRNQTAVVGSGIVNSVINKLPFELHIPGYQFCGPGTKLEKRLERGDRGINKLDEACREHDIAYNEHQDLENRHKADRILLERAKERRRAPDASIGEKFAALGVSTAMSAKLKLGMGCPNNKMQKHRRRIGKVKKSGKGLIKFSDLISKAKNTLNNGKFDDMKSAIGAAIKAVKQLRGKKKVHPKRVISVPKTGGALPLIPIFAALGALGSLGGGAAAVARAVNQAKVANEQLKENKRHNQAMEAVALGKNKDGNGLYLKPYKTGLGLFLDHSKFPKKYR